MPFNDVGLVRTVLAGAVAVLSGNLFVSCALNTLFPGAVPKLGANAYSQISHGLLEWAVGLARMKRILKSKIGRQFLGLFLLLSLPVIAAGWFGIRSAMETLRKQTHAVLRAASDGAEAQLREFLRSLKETTEAVASDGEIRSSVKSPSEIGGNLSRLLERLRKTVPEVQMIFCMNLQGRVVASSSPQMMGKDESGSDLFERGRRSYYPGDIISDGDARGGTRWEMSAPVRESASGPIVGVVAMEIDSGALSALTTGKRVLAEGADTQSFRIGETGETYIVNRKGLLLTQSRFAPNAILKVKVETYPVRAALEQGREILGDYRDYRGVAVSGASAILPDMGWVLITEIDFRQAFAPLVKLRAALIWMAAGIGLFAILMARHFVQGIVEPLQMAAQADRALARGEEQAAIVPEQNLAGNEIGEFIRKRNIRIKALIERQRELVREQKARAEAAAELEQLSYSMVHDMRAPLRAIVSFGDLIEQETEHRLSDTQREYLARMRESSGRMDRLICDMLRYSSLLRADVPLSPVNPVELLRDVVDDNAIFRAHKNDIEIEDRMPLVIGNSRILAECFSALLDNAFRYTRPGVAPKATVRAEAMEGSVRIFVEDNGTGMPKEFQERAFGIFQKGTNSQQGSGIGLALVRVAVERMGGHVGVTSEEGKGSRFWIDLKPAD